MYPDGSDSGAIATLYDPGGVARTKSPSVSVVTVIVLPFAAVAEITTPEMPSPASESTRPSMRAGVSTMPKSTWPGPSTSTRDGVVKNAGGLGGSCATTRCGPGLTSLNR